MQHIICKKFIKHIKKKLLDTGLDFLKTASEKVVHNTGEYLGNKIAGAVTNLCDDKVVKTKPIEKIIILPEKREEILNELGQEL